MAHSMTTGMLAATKAATLAPVLFVEIDTADGNVYMWNGVGTITWDGNDWVGAGELINIEPVEETNQLQASSAAISLSGVDSALVSIALQSIRRYLPAKIWVGALDLSTGVIIPDPYLIRNGRVDTASITDQGTTSTIAVTAESRLISMMNARERRYTDQDQQIEHPGDFGFSFVDKIQNTIIVWGQLSL